jgi:cell wall-associated NlpC family hydrolase
MNIRGWLLAAALAAGLGVARPALADVLYSVRPGDTLAKIAARHNIKVLEIVTANPALGGKTEVSEGMVLVLPVEEEPAIEEPAAEAAEPDAEPPAPTMIRIEGRPEHLNKIVGSDGKVLVVPDYRGSRAGDPHGQQLASRRGRLIMGVTSTARRFLGVPYSMGGTTSRAFDCSGFVMRVFLIHGIQLPRTCDVQWQKGRPVPRGKEEPGDLVFFETYLPGPSHVGIYLGNGNFIHASSSRGVTISSLKETYYRARYLGARRVL